jgi:hypothetical protein
VTGAASQDTDHAARDRNSVSAFRLLAGNPLDHRATDFTILAD